MSFPPSAVSNNLTISHGHHLGRRRVHGCRDNQSCFKKMMTAVTARRVRKNKKKRRMCGGVVLAQARDQTLIANAYFTRICCTRTFGASTTRKVSTDDEKKPYEKPNGAPVKISSLLSHSRSYEKLDGAQARARVLASLGPKTGGDHFRQNSPK